MIFEAGQWYNLKVKCADEFAECCEDNAKLVQTVIQPFKVLNINKMTGGVTRFENAMGDRFLEVNADIISGIDADLFDKSHPIHPWLMRTSDPSDMIYIPEPYRTGDINSRVYRAQIAHDVVDVSKVCQEIDIETNLINASAICYQMDYGYRYGWKNWSAK